MLPDSGMRDAWQSTRREVLAVFFVLGLCLVANLLTCRLYPAVWADEVSFAEPAMNFAQHEGFITRVWPYQPVNTFPTVNCPLYSMLLAGWLSLIGPSLLAARSLNYVLVGVLALLAWGVCRRFGLVRQPFNRLWIILMIELGYGLSTAYRSCRPDMVGAVLLAGLALASGIERRRWRFWIQVGISLLIVWTGLQVALAAAFAAFLAWVLLRHFSFRDLLAMAMGMMLGAGSLVLFFAHHAALSNFIISVLSVTDSRMGMQPAGGIAALAKHLLFGPVHKFFDDFSLWPVFAGVLVFGWATRRYRLQSGGCRLTAFLVLLMVFPPFLLGAMGHFVIFYSYLVFIPACLLFFKLSEQVLEPANPAAHPFLRMLVIGLVALSVCLGLPLRLALAARFCESNAQSWTVFLTRQLHSDDVVFADYQMFFDIRAIARTVYVPDENAAWSTPRFPKRQLTTAQRAGVSVLVIPPAQTNYYTRWFGGAWRPVDGLFGDVNRISAVTNRPVVGKRVARYFSQAPSFRQRLQFMRRD